MLLLTLLALEGMARLAYYAAYGQEYGGGLNTLSELTSPPQDFARKDATPSQIRHPFYGFSHNPAYAALNAMPPPRRRQDTVVVGLLGGSVAQDVQPFLQRALNHWFAANQSPRRTTVLKLAAGAAKQPQQTMIVANTLLLGGEFDLIVNLDGLNELGGSAGQNPQAGVFPFFPLYWHQRVSLTGAEILQAGGIGVLRREQARRTAAGETSPLRRSALFGLINRWRQERIAAAIIRRNQQLAAMTAAYSPERHGSRNWRQREAELLPAAARVWYRGSLMLSRLAEVAGADYYHFLQPNQYVPDAKPLSPKEREVAWSPDAPEKPLVEQGYPLLREFNRDLQRQGINYFDLTGIFADHPETLYIDACCHLNARGNERLAAAMARRMEPALLRLGQVDPAAAVSPLAAARRTAQPNPAGYPGFRVSLQDNGKYLRYIREDCATEDRAARFFLHLMPRDLTDLPPGRRKQGFDDVAFNFADAGGRFQRGQCVAQFPLPDYPIAALRTGQQIPWQGELWSTELIVPADPGQLRAEYAALSAAEPAAMDYFALYRQDNRLLYLRETCTTEDVAAGFFLHIIPEYAADLPAERRDAGFVHSGFDFGRRGGHFDGKCLAAVALPDYPIAGLRTGQHIPGQGDLWSVELIAAPDFDQLRADYAALSAANPAARNYFDLYLRDNRLLYLRETCAAADTAAGFFLHIVPENPADLSAERRDAGFANRDFAFERWGGHFDGKCLAAVPLPNYPLKEIRAGQHSPGQEELWAAELAGG